jgi:hypothetical protein
LGGEKDNRIPSATNNLCKVDLRCTLVFLIAHLCINRSQRWNSYQSDSAPSWTLLKFQTVTVPFSP